VASVAFEEVQGQFQYSVQVFEYFLFINYANTRKYLHFTSEGSRRVEKIEI
jgi:hypothetical protein